MLTPRNTLVASAIIPVIILRVFIFIKTETKNAEKNSSAQTNTRSAAVVKETMLALRLDIYFSIELCVHLTLGLQQPALSPRQSCLGQALSFSFATGKEAKDTHTIIPIPQTVIFLSKKIFKIWKEGFCCVFWGVRRRHCTL